MAKHDTRLRRLERQQDAAAEDHELLVWIGDGPPPAGPRYVQDLLWVDDDTESDRGNPLDGDSK